MSLPTDLEAPWVAANVNSSTSSSSSSQQSGSRIYFYNKKTQVSSWTLPGVAGFSSREDIIRNLSDDQAKWIQLGDYICVQGLKVNKECNGHTGLVTCFHEGRVIVKLHPEFGGYDLSVGASSIRPLPIGTFVELQQLEAYRYNGLKAQVVFVDYATAKYTVAITPEQHIVVKASKVKALSRLAVPKWNVPPEQWLKAGANAEKSEFTDSKGNSRRFWLHLPTSFDEAKAAAVKWPLLVYLHGNGTPSEFYDLSKKSIKHPGYKFSSLNFVVISPACKWTWKQPPEKDWVIELVELYRTCNFVDAERIYITGCSMGGNAAWEIGSHRPDLFAAVAPVAAYHSEDLQDKIASGLANKPVCCCSGDLDVTCPMSKEEPLWHKLVTTNMNFQVNIAHGADHGSMFKRSYQDSQLLFEWLLMFKLEA